MSRKKKAALLSALVTVLSILLGLSGEDKPKHKDHHKVATTTK